MSRYKEKGITPNKKALFTDVFEFKIDYKNINTLKINYLKTSPQH